MAVLDTPVELPASRHSFVEFPMTANVQDPTSWGTLTNDGNLTRHNTKSTIASEFMDHTTAATSRQPSQSQKGTRVKASPATELPPQELEAQPLSYFPPRQSSALANRTDSSQSQGFESNTNHFTQTSDNSTQSNSSASTAGTQSVQEGQIYSLPKDTVLGDDTVESPVAPSIRSAGNSVKKSAVPTSKYKKKPPLSLKSSVKQRNDMDLPLASPMSNYTQILQSPTSDGFVDPMLSELPANMESALPTPPPEAQTRQGQTSLQHAKSTASVRKARALHSHPSMPTLRPDDFANSPIVPQPPPNPSIMKGRKSVDTIRSRPSLSDLQQPSPAPNTPLPELPVGVQPLSRPASRDVAAHPIPPPEVYVRPGTSSSMVTPTLRRQDTNPPVHAEMANYMTSNSKVIFRRFHDVHIRLLLTLQDEISVLEKELADIENTDHAGDVDRESRRVRIMSELRKLLAEYDHLFSNWNLMQASKADAKTREELESFLKQSANTSNSQVSIGAIADLVWLQTYNDDLSCVDLNAKKAKVSIPPQEATVEKKELNLVPQSEPPRSTGGGGLSALFASCTGKRK